jgi:ribonuclease HII
MPSHRRFIASDDVLLQPEREAADAGFNLIAGVDEAGRGPLAGPVVAAAVILPTGIPLPGVFDSKALSAKVREELFEELFALKGVDIGVGIVEAPMIDEINILRATHLAMRLALEKLKSVDFALVDGLPVKGLPVQSKNLVKGDSRCASIAAASIIAKVTRDRIMIEADREYPGYGFASHKGYGCAAHIEAIRNLGVTPLHRRSFAPVRQILSGEEPPEQLELW